jgi:S1-C subfamily serine protease
MVYDFRLEERKAAGTWKLDDVWVYPSPENLGLTLDLKQGNHVLTVQPNSPASRAGVRAKDTLQSLNGFRVVSFADAQYALEHAPAEGSVGLSWQRGDQAMHGKLSLAPGWRKTDISWRASMWGLEPATGVYGPDLSVQEKKTLGLGDKVLAFRQASPVPISARKAGIQAHDIILGVAGEKLAMTMIQFNAYIRLTRKVGDQVVFNVLRGGKRMELPMKLPRRDEY